MNLKTLLRRIIYGRHFSEPTDRFFQDHVLIREKIEEERQAVIKEMDDELKDTDKTGGFLIPENVEWATNTFIMAYNEHFKQQRLEADKELEEWRASRKSKDGGDKPAAIFYYEK